MKIIKAKDWSEVPDNFTGKVEYEHGIIRYFLNKKLHRFDGPAYIDGCSYQSYWINGKRICDSYDKDYEQIFYNSKEYKVAKQQEDLLKNIKKIKNI